MLAPLLGLAMIANGQPAAGSFAAGAAVAAVGVAFTGVAAVTSQLSSTARGANGLAMAALAVAFVVSGVGNMLGDVDAADVVAYSAWPTWLSPIGWGYQMRPFGGDHWWLLALSVVLAVVLIAAAGRYAARRDLGRGLLPEQTGRAQASRRLLGPFGLAWRLQRSAFLAWLVGIARVRSDLRVGHRERDGPCRAASGTGTSAWAATSEMLACLRDVDDRDGRHDGRHLRGPGPAADARGGGPRPARAGPRGGRRAGRGG